MELPSPAPGPAAEERHSGDVAQHRLDHLRSTGFRRSAAADGDQGNDIEAFDDGGLGIPGAFPSSASNLSRLRINEGTRSINLPTSL